MIIGEEMAFSAKPADDTTLAGLFRAEFNDGEDDMVAGWIVDEGDDAVGTTASSSGKSARPRLWPRMPTASDVYAANGSGEAVKGQRVTDPKSPPKGEAGRVITPELREELLSRIADRATARGSSPIAGIVLNEAKRFLANEEPKGKLEEKAFGIFKKIPKVLLKQYVSDWDAVPAGIRRKLVGAVLAAPILPSRSPWTVVACLGVTPPCGGIPTAAGTAVAARPVRRHGGRDAWPAD